MGLTRWMQKKGSTGSIARWVAARAADGAAAGWTLDQTIQTMLQARYALDSPNGKVISRLRAALKVSPPHTLSDLASLIFFVEMGEQADWVVDQALDVMDEVLEERGASRLFSE